MNRTVNDIKESINELLELKTYENKIKWSNANKAELLRLEAAIRKIRNQADTALKQDLLGKDNHTLGCMLECYAEVIGYRLGFTKESMQLEEIASKLK